MLDALVITAHIWAVACLHISISAIHNSPTYIPEKSPGRSKAFRVSIIKRSYLYSWYKLPVNLQHPARQYPPYKFVSLKTTIVCAIGISILYSQSWGHSNQSMSVPPCVETHYKGETAACTQLYLLFRLTEELVITELDFKKSTIHIPLGA